MVDNKTPNNNIMPSRHIISLNSVIPCIQCDVPRLNETASIPAPFILMLVPPLPEVRIRYKILRFDVLHRYKILFRFLSSGLFVLQIFTLYLPLNRVFLVCSVVLLQILWAWSFLFAFLAEVLLLSCLFGLHF